MRTLKSGLLAACAAAMLATPMFAATAKAETKILFNRFVPPKHPFNVGMFIPWAQDVEKATDGRVKVEFPTATLAPPQKQWNMVTSGIADVAMLANAFERKRLQLPVIAQLPFVGSTAEARGVALWRTQVEYFDKANEYKGIKLIGAWTLSGATIYHGSKPITKAEDLKNEKMWALAGLPNATLTKFGAVVVSVPGVQMFNVISKGIVNGFTTSDYSLNSFKVMPYVKYATRIPGGLNSVSFSLLMNKKKFDGLTKEDRDAVWSVSGERVAANAGRKTDELDQKSIADQKNAGIERLTASPEFIAQLENGTQFLVDEWLKAAKSRGIDGAAALDYYKTQANSVSPSQ